MTLPSAARAIRRGQREDQPGPIVSVTGAEPDSSKKIRSCMFARYAWSVIGDANCDFPLTPFGGDGGCRGRGRHSVLPTGEQSSLQDCGLDPDAQICLAGPDRYFLVRMRCAQVHQDRRNS